MVMHAVIIVEEAVADPEKGRRSFTYIRPLRRGLGQRERSNTGLPHQCINEQDASDAKIDHDHGLPDFITEDELARI